MAPRPLLIVSNRGPIRFVAGDDGERTAGAAEAAWSRRCRR